MTKAVPPAEPWYCSFCTKTQDDVKKLIVAPADVDPIIYRSQIIQVMAARYQQAVPDLSNEQAHDAAMSTWGTDWDADPEPRTIEASRSEVDADLSYWGEE